MSFGQNLLRQYLARLLPFEMHENFRPSWLDGLELDFWYPTLSVAIEFQGGQHYVPRDGDRGALFTQRRNDSRKVKILRDRQILLVRIDAIHLGARSLIGRINAVARHHRHQLHLAPGHTFIQATRALDRSAQEYRQSLRRTFGCPTAHRRGHQPRLAATKARFAA